MIWVGKSHIFVDVIYGLSLAHVTCHVPHARQHCVLLRLVTISVCIAEGGLVIDWPSAIHHVELLEI